MLVFDIVVNGEVKETVKPMSQRMKDILVTMQEKMKDVKAKYGHHGNNVQVKKRILR
ncbi:mechanosensitive ion channel protein MscL [Paenibacillus thalictri]|uniref:Mechanosensitive ion channel protein MscL n=1 Tax=Paenibacillus thalictri TaxID=2527873 RepID=A0A4Q9DU43_9BACL|nr:mechanosensitive ion channel protein MscL [Paenibacillus thalictri]TBL78217.1 mechanosensitive ion channel protein MscL [Paenibacillus thalictri]